MNPDKEALEKLRNDYPEGCRVQLVQMNDEFAPRIGTYGTVTCVDDMGTIHVAWENGSSLGVVYGIDICRKVK